MKVWNVRNPEIAASCIETRRRYGTYRGEGIGRVVTEFYGGSDRYASDCIVLFEEEPAGRLTVEIPLTPEEIERERSRGSKLTTTGVIVGIPKEYVGEIRVWL